MFSNLLRNINVLNLLLLAAILGFAAYLLIPLMDSPVTYSPPAVRKAAVEKSEGESPPPPAVNPLEFTVIADQNLFHPDRKIPPEKKAEAAVPKPEFVLFGTLTAGDLAVAYMEDKKAAPVTTPGRGKRQTAVKKGESLSGYVLKEIQPDRVVMNRGEESLVVYLNDPQNPKTREVLADTGRPGSRPGHAPGSPPRPSVSPTTAEARAAAATPRPKPSPRPASAAAAVPAPTTVPTVNTGAAVSPTTTTGGTFTPARPRYRPLPPTPATVPAGPYPAPGSGTSPTRQSPYP